MNKKSEEKRSFFARMEYEVLDFWERAKIFEKSVERDAPEGDYVFYDGPPFATGMPHYGHIVASVMKDAVPRYWTMRGYRVQRRWGWDCHGLPVENLAEKELGFRDKTDIEKQGVEKFNNYCQSIVLRYVKEWKKIIRRIGRWVDMENDYKTMDPDYMESIWWVFKQLWDKGLIYEGYKAMHICPRCGTTLSNFEVSLGYKEVKDISATVKFELVDEPGTYVLAWTTTPWTLIGNVALAVGEEIEYVVIKTKTADQEKKDKNNLFIVAKDRLKDFFQEGEYEVVKKLKGSDLVGKRYKPLFNYYAQDGKIENRENGWQIYLADFVTTEEGTGIVHIAPAFGEEDMELGKKYNLPFIQHVDMDGRFKPEVADWPGVEVKPKEDPKATDKKIVAWLREHGALFSSEEYEHSYPHCWRCDTPLLNYAAKSWFVEVTKIKDKLIENNQKIRWVPAHIKAGRFGKWLEQARDWAISRSRYWGDPLPVWVCEKCGQKTVVGSRAELKKLSGRQVDDLHKQFVDKITWPCQQCGGTMKRIPEVLDCWFESGSMPYAQEHYPFENKEKFERNFPADFIAEGVDQTRGWFYTLHVLAGALEINGVSSPAFKNVIVNGIVLAEDGQKMSKRLKNYPDPSELFDKYSVDAMRYYLLTSPVLLAENLNFSEKGVEEVLRKVEIILWNVYKFYAMYAGELKIKSEKLKVKSDNVLDKWILARLNQLIGEVTENMNNYLIPKAVRPIEGFINDLSTWYLRRSRARFREEGKDKEAALEITGFVLIQLAKIMAPFMPFLAEQIWQKVTGFDFKDENQSVHLQSWIEAQSTEHETEEKEILENMQMTRKIVEMGLAKRDEVGIKVRQPLNELKVKNCQLSDEYADLIKDELNIKKIEFIPGERELAVELDTEITEELKLEGIKRELVRLINNLRKQAGLTIADKITVFYQTSDPDIQAAITKFSSDIASDVLSDSLKQGISDADTFTLQKSLKINSGEITLAIKKV